MKTKHKSEQGQAIVMIAFAIMGLFALVALAMDGGHAFSDRRQAQNAADAAALAVAMRYAKKQDLNPFVNTTAFDYYNTIAQASTTANGYSNTLPRSKVILTVPRIATNDECVPYNGVTGLVFQVDIDSYLETWFGSIIGVNQVHNHVSGTSLSCPPYRSTAYSGNTIVALSKTACRAMEFAGSSSTVVTSSTGQGLYIRSACTGSGTGDPQNALYGGSGTVTAPAVKVVGGVYTPSVFKDPDGNNLTVATGAAPIDDIYAWPTIDEVCPASTPTSTVVSGNTLTPGLFPGSNSSWASKTFPPAGVSALQPGIYCLDKDFKTTNTDALTGNGVTIVMRDGSVNIQGGSIKLWAPTGGLTQGLLFYLPSTNTGDDVSVSGSGSSEYHGSIVAPLAHVTINGSSNTDGPFQTQLVADTVTIGGSGTVALQYDATVQYKPPHPANIQLFR